MADVLCFGNLQLDVLCRPLTAPPAPGELREIEGIDVALSGNGGNVAMALGRLGIDAALAGYYGADVVGEQLRATLDGAGVNTTALRRHPTAGTGISVIHVAPNGERGILFVNGANADVELETVPDATLRGARVVLVSAVFVLPRFTGQAIALLFARARAAGAVTALNVCWDHARRGLPFLAPALAETNLFVLNHDEGRQLTGRSRPEDILDALEAVTRGAVVLTLGPEGSMLRGEDGPCRIPAAPVVATDSTGAGDSFLAGVIAGLVTGRTLKGCARLGSRVAAYAVTGPGAYPRIPTLDEIDRLYGYDAYEGGPS